MEAIPVEWIENYIEELLRTPVSTDEPVFPLTCGEIVILEDLIYKWRKENDKSQGLQDKGLNMASKKAKLVIELPPELHKQMINKEYLIYILDKETGNYIQTEYAVMKDEVQNDKD